MRLDDMRQRAQQIGLAHDDGMPTASGHRRRMPARPFHRPRVAAERPQDVENRVTGRD